MLTLVHQKLIFPLIELIRREPINRFSQELNKTQWYKHEQLRELQWNKLKRLIDHCYLNIPFYRKRFDVLKLRPEDIRSFKDYRKIPLLTKDEIRSHQDEIRDRNFKNKVEYGHSGGTLGKPLDFIRDSWSSAYARAAQLRGLNWYGISNGDKQLRIWGIPFNSKVARKEKIKDFLLNRFRISAFEIKKERMVEYYKIIKKTKPKYIYGFTSAIYRICQLMQEKGVIAI